MTKNGNEKLQQYHKDAKKIHELMYWVGGVMADDGIKDFADYTLKQLLSDADTALDVMLGNGWESSHDTPQAFNGEVRRLQNFIRKYKGVNNGL